MWELKFTNSVRKYVSLILRLLTVFKFGKAVELRGFFISFTDFILSVLLAVNLSLLKAYTSLKLLLRASKIDLVLPFEDLFSEMSFRCSAYKPSLNCTLCDTQGVWFQFAPCR